MTAPQGLMDATELGSRLGVLFVLALQINDADLHEAAFIDGSELGMSADGPVFLPVETLAAERDRLKAINGELVKALEEIDCTPAAMVNDSESLRHTIKVIRHISSAALSRAKEQEKAP